MSKETKVKVSATFNFAELYQYPLNGLLEILPENTVLVKDSGLWGLFNDTYDECYISQECNEDLKSMITRYILTLDMDEIMAYNWYKLNIS